MGLVLASPTGSYSTLRIDSGKKYVFSMASKNVRKLCGAHVYCNLKQQNAVVQKNNNVAARKTGGRFGASYGFAMYYELKGVYWPKEYRL